MKRRILIGILILSLLPWATVQGEELAFDAYLGFQVNIATPPWNTITFYSNYSDLFYVFFEYNRPIVGFTTYYVTSVDGINWSNHTRMFYPDDAAAWRMSAGRWDLYLEPNGRYLHGAIIYTPASPNSIRYFKRELFRNGSLGLCGYPTQIPQIIFNEDLGAYGEASKYIDIYLDNESYPFITFTSYQSEGGWETGFLIEGDYPINESGHWEWGDYNLVQWQAEFGNLWDDQWKCTVTGVSDDKTETGFGRGVHWMQTHEASLLSDQEASASAMNYYNGSGWINLHGGGASALWDHEGGGWADEAWDIAAIGNITLYVKQTETGSDPDTIRLSYGTRIGGGDWETVAHPVSDEYLGDEGSVWIAPHIGIDYNRNVVIVWNIHSPDNNTVWYRKGQIQFNGSMTWQTEVIQWENWDQFGNWFFDSVGSGMAEPLPFNVPLSLSYDDDNAEWMFHDYIFTQDNGELLIPAVHLNTTLTGPNGEPIGTSGYDNWIFEGEVYDLVSFVENATSFYVNTTDSRHDIRFNWDNETEQMWISVNPRDQFTIGLAHSEFERTGNITRLLWRFIPNRNIIDCVNESWAYYIENEDMGYEVYGDLDIETNIYNLGGLTSYAFTGDGGRTVGGQPFEIYATNGSDGSSARAEQIYRKLQSIHFLIEIDMDNEWEDGPGAFDIDPGVGFVDIGIDYRLNATWVEGFSVRLYVESANVGHHNAGDDHNWIEWAVDWHNYDPGSGLQQNFRSGLIYSNHWGYDNENLSPDYHNRTSSQIWVDLWFDRTNASTTVAGQVNALFHGMREHGSSWWFGYGEFQPMISDYGNALMLDDLYDEGGNVTDSMKFDLMRVFVEVGKVANPADGDDETWTIRAIENFNRKQADDRMQGVEQPAFEETLVLDMPMFQSMNPLIRAIDGISIAIWKGALGFQKILWGAMDSFFSWAGFGEGFFSSITAFLMMIPQVFTTIMQNMGMAITHLVTMIDNTFTMVITMLPEFVLGLTWLTNSILDYWRILNDLLGGGLMPFNIIQELGMGLWIRFGFAMLPFFEIMGVLFSNTPGQRVKERVGFYSGLFNGAINFINRMITFMQNAIQTIMEILPG